MINMTVLEIAFYLVAFNVPCFYASGYSNEKCSQKDGDCEENGSVLVTNKGHC